MTAFLSTHPSPPEGSTAQGKAVNRVLANKFIGEGLAKLPSLTTQNAKKPKAKPEKVTQSSEEKAKKSPAKPIKKEAATTTSSFLPSLATGFTFGESDSEGDAFPLEDDEQPKRKNRRGQRARQA